jgi:tRNA 2-(methylsulfanyl)-N6-isopentenyladenosine37 hydroxylase
MARMEIADFLILKTPAHWTQYAVEHIDMLLLDHAHCEKKAAQTAINLIVRYPDFHDLVYRLSRFAREELRHFEQVYKIMRQRGVALDHLTASRYAKGLFSHAKTFEPDRLVDSLIIAAFIEARSCERFHAMIPFLDDELAQFYSGLLSAEKRHFTEYLFLAHKAAACDIDDRIAFFAKIESSLITTPDVEFRFHSGVPA